MSPLADVAPQLLARARADQVATLYAGWHRTTLSMLLGATLFCAALWQVAPHALLAAFVALILLNQAWRGLLVRAWRRASPGIAAVARWGRYWTTGSALAGALWGLAAITLYPASLAHQALVIVCLFGVVMGGLNLTAVYKPAFYGFVVPALVPLIVRVALDGDAVHLFTALVMTVVLAFVLGFGHRLNDVLTHALATRYENVDLIAELRSQTRAALDARANAEAANRAKSQLLAAASHDLRQPLHALALFVAALVNKVRDAEIKPLVGNVQRSVHTLEAQFAQLLDLSRLEAGALEPAPRPVALAPLFSHLTSEFAPQAAARGLRFAVVRTRAAVESDPALLERILKNLVANAIRYTRTGGVVIGARRRGATVAIEVVDTGAGIAPEHRSRIFDEFYQVRSAAARQSDGRGMGLGLAIVRRFADLLGHRIELATRVGHGSRFTVVARRTANAVALRAARPSPLARPIDTPLEGALVAVIDDDATAIEAMRALFGTWGATVAGGPDADAVLTALGAIERYPDLIVADLRLADDDCGLAAVARLRDELGEDVPALVVSGDNGAEAAREVRAAGLPMLGKPVVAAALKAASAALVASAGARAGG